MNLAILGFESIGKELYEILISKKSLIYRNYTILQKSSNNSKS